MVASDAPESDEQVMARVAEDLVSAVEDAIGPWVRAAVARRYPGPLPVDIERRTEAAAAAATVEVGGLLRNLLARDIDDQWTNPLAVIRKAVAYPTGILADAGVAPVARDADDARINPDDVYALAPATFAEVGENVHEPGIVWGAAKAHVHLSRRRRGGAG